MGTWQQIVQCLSAYIQTEEKKSEIARVLRPAQFLVFRQLRRFFENGGKDGFIKLPTGVGKTVLFIEFLRATKLRALIVVPTNILTLQTAKRLEEFAEELDVGQINAFAKDFNSQVTIITYASLIRQLKAGKLYPGNFECLILDEAHKALAPGAAQAIRQFSDIPRLGFTATPDYSEERRLVDLLEQEICSMSVRSAIEDGLLANCSVVLALTQVSLADVPVVGGRYKERDLVRVVNIAARNEAAVQLYQQMFMDKWAIAYCVNIVHAESLAKCFAERNIAVAAISGKNTQAQRRQILTAFREGSVKVLCNADVLIHGFDERRASVCFNLRPTLSRVIAEQRGGRVLRLDEDSPNKEAVVVEFLDRSGTSRMQPISYAEILNSAYVSRREVTFAGGGDSAISRTPFEALSIAGVQVIVNAEHVMRVVHNRNRHTAPKRGWIRTVEFRNRINDAFSKIVDSFGIVEMQWVQVLEHIKQCYPDSWKQHLLFGKEEHEFYDPIIVSLLTQEFIDKDKRWRDVLEVSDDLETSAFVVGAIAQRYINTSTGIHIRNNLNPLHEILFIPGTTRIRRFCDRLVLSDNRGCDCMRLHPHFEAKIVQDISVKISNRDVEENIEWLNIGYTIRQIANDLSVPTSLPRRFITCAIEVERLRVRFPRWFRNTWYTDDRGLNVGEESSLSVLQELQECYPVHFKNAQLMEQFVAEHSESDLKRMRTRKSNPKTLSSDDRRELYSLAQQVAATGDYATALNNVLPSGGFVKQPTLTRISKGNWQCKVFIGKEVVIGYGAGRSDKIARQMAARQVFVQLEKFI